MKVNKEKSFLFYINLIAGLGISFILPLLLCTYIGVKLTDHFGYSEKTVIFFILFGLIVGVYNIYQTINNLLKDLQSEQ